MQTLDDAWNNQDWETFKRRHAENTRVHWPGVPTATEGRLSHETECKEFFKTFPDNHIRNRPYKIFFAQGNYTCSIAEFTGTMKGPMNLGGGKVASPTNKSFHIEFCTVATWKEGEIVEERLNYDLVGFLRQIGLST